MLPDLSARLSKAIEQKRRKQKLENDLLAVDAEGRETASRLASLGQQLEKEKMDVEKLEHTSLTGLFYSVLGSREEQLEKERQELLTVQLQYQQTRHQAEYLERERAFLQGQIANLAGLEAEFERLFSQKEDLLRGSNPAVAAELIENAEQIAHLAAEAKEISEAIHAGKEVVAGLDQVLDSLESAKGWGTWDFLGGGVISTAIKHSRIDEAQRGIHTVQAMMSRFHRELADVRERAELRIEIGEFEAFADFFFDGLIFDWIVQSKIYESLERAKQARIMLTQAVAELEILKREAETSLAALQKKRAQIIERA